MSRTKPAEVEIETPAIVTPAHTQDRELTTVAGGPRGWRKLSPLQVAHQKNQLAGGNPNYHAHQRYEAAMIYTAYFDTAQPNLPSSSDFDRVRGAGNGLPLSQAYCNATQALIAIESHLGRADRTIVRKVCGEGETLANAVRLACGPDFAKATLARFREALDALIEAEEAARRKPRVMNMRVLP